MKKKMVFLFSLFLAGANFGLSDDKQPAALACSDEEAMVRDYEKGLSDLVDTIKKEKLDEFQRTFHRRTFLSKLNLTEGILDMASACLDEAIKNPSTTKANGESYRAKRDAYAKLKEKLIQYRDSLKAAGEDKQAKALIETFLPAN